MTNPSTDDTELRLMLNLDGGSPPKSNRTEENDAIMLNYQRVLHPQKGRYKPKTATRTYDVSDIPIDQRGELRSLIRRLSLDDHAITTVSNLLTAIVAVSIVNYQRYKKSCVLVDRIESRGGTIAYNDGLLAKLYERSGHFFDGPVEVNLSHCRLEQGDLRGIEKWTSLERCYLDRTGIELEDVERVARCPRLKRLSLWGTSLDGRVLDVLENCEALQVLDLNGTNLNPSQLGPLGELPNLKHLIFDCEFRSDDSARMNPEVVHRLSSIRRLEPVGKCFLQGLDESGIMRFFENDTSRITELLLRDCELSDAVCQRISQSSISRLDLQRCQFDEGQLRWLDPEQFVALDLSNRKGKALGVSMAEMTAWLPQGLTRVAVFEDYIRFHYGSGSQWRYRLQDATEPITEEILERWIDLGMNELSLYRDDQSLRNLTVIETLNPSIKLTIRCDEHSMGWHTIPELEQLEWLEIRCSQPVTADIIQQLHPLNHLRHVSVQQGDQKTLAVIGLLRHLLATI